ncbi:MAG TPA: DUF1697 domain-containing protein [Acidimicrobiales bacterium]|nr:DUF1697 domain-containing protein [Acidimicrobiales bacterium]
MASHVALLRGVNVGGRNRLSMADLRSVMEDLGHREVRTYIQSGNAVFGADGHSAVLARQLAQAVGERLGIRPHVVVLSRGELAAVVAANPFPDVADPKALHAGLRHDEPGEAARAVMESARGRAQERGSGEDVRLVGRTLYLHTPAGLGRSDLAAQLALAGGPLAAGEGTTLRNWATVTRLLAMCDE